MHAMMSLAKQKLHRTAISFSDMGAGPEQPRIVPCTFFLQLRQACAKGPLPTQTQQSVNARSSFSSAIFCALHSFSLISCLLPCPQHSSSSDPPAIDSSVAAEADDDDDDGDDDDDDDDDEDLVWRADAITAGLALAALEAHASGASSESSSDPVGSWSCSVD